MTTRGSNGDVVREKCMVCQKLIKNEPMPKKEALGNKSKKKTPGYKKFLAWKKEQ